jgi:hypothetical protein
VVQDVSLEGERIFSPEPGELASLPYFSLVVVPPAGRARRPIDAEAPLRWGGRS